MRRSLSRTLAAGVLAGLLALVACGDDGGSGAAPTTSGEGGGSAMPSRVRIGYQQIPNGDLVVKHEGWLEEAFGSDVSVEWKLFDSGGSVNEAILAGGIDIGLVGSSPAARGISAEIPYQVPWIFDVIGKAEALVVKEGIETFEDLKGKRVATPFASTAHYSLLAALQDAGIADGDVQVIDAEPDAIFASWERGDIDAAYVWNPNLAKMVEGGGTFLITSEDLAAKGKTTYDLAVVTNSFAQQYPEAVRMWLEQQTRAVELIREDPDAASAAVAAELNITAEEALAQMNDLVFLTADEQVGDEYLGGGLARNLFAAAEFNKELGRIETVQPEQAYIDAVVATFAAEVAGG
jgi:taurine transport system substrate-binding protein